MNRSSAMTAFGELVHIPPAGSVHILVAGFACVDFSTLNNKRKRLVVNLEELPPEQLLEVLGGESSVTLTAILRYARQCRPPILILENILGASWNQIIKLFEQIDYSAGVVRLDTKYFYLPQTRQRGYLICISNKQAEGIGGMRKPTAEAAVQDWAKIVRNLMRTASSPVDDFLFHDNHPDLVRSLQKIALESGTQWETDFAKDWSVCWGRYQRFRESRCLGGATPYTYWTSGKVKPPEHANAVWIQKQPNRVKDTFDCLYLLSAQNSRRNYDASFKSRFPDASQNVDRSLDMAKPGIVGCITPNNVIFHMGKGRPPVGLELLRLQGMNSDHLLIGREAQRQLRDLAGNAMSTTVVGSAIISALIAAFGAFDPRTWGKRQEVAKRSWIGDEFSIDAHSDLFATYPLNFGPLETVLSKVHFCQLATLSVRQCFCEGLWNQSLAPISRCRECEHTACSECGGNPVHTYTQIQNETRYNARVFTSTAFKYLPTRLRLRNFEHLQFLVFNAINGMIIKEKLAVLTSRFKMALENETKERLIIERKEKRVKKATSAPGVLSKGKKQPVQAGSNHNLLVPGNTEHDPSSNNITTDTHPEIILQLHPDANEGSDDDSGQPEPSQRDANNVLKSFAEGNLGDRVGPQHSAIANSIINISFEDEDLLMSAPERSHVWTITYESRNLKLKLVLKNNSAEWLLYVKAPNNLAAGSKIRSILAQPVASMTPNICQNNSSIWNGKWRAHIYDTREYMVRIQAQGKLIPSWKAQLGLKRHLSDKIYDQLSIFSISNGRDSVDKAILDHISGTYQLLPRCGTATRSLHRQATALEPASEPLYLFLNSMPNQRSDLDEFIIAKDHERIADSENHRYTARITALIDEQTGIPSADEAETNDIPAALVSGLSQNDQSLVWQYLTNGDKTILSFKPDLAILISKSSPSCRLWRPSRKPFQLAKIAIDYRTETFGGSLEAVEYTKDLCTMAVAPEALDRPSSIHHDGNSYTSSGRKTINCRASENLLLKYSMPWHSRNPNGHTSHEPCFITELNQSSMQLNIEWLTSRINLQSELRMWNPVATGLRDFQCGICSPPLPAYVNRQTPTGGLLPMEDPEAVLRYLDLWKRKPRPFIISMRRRGQGIEWQDLCITVNIQSLIHRLLAGLPILIHRDYVAQEVSWRMRTNVMLDKYDANSLNSLRVHDCTRETPLHFAFGSSKLSLRGDQARVFRWMKGRDTVEADPFREVVVEESVSTHLRWSIEAQSTRTAVVRGGLCADHVGFGKTVVALAVIRDHITQAKLEAEMRINSQPQTHIPVHATLILVPGALAFQWADEINRFWNECKWILVRSMDDLYKYSVHDIQDADVVIASTDLLQRDRNPDYINRIAEIAGMADPAPFTSPRQYTEWVKSASSHVSSFVQDFQNQDLSYAQCIRNLQDRSFQNLLDTRQYLEQSKRFRGRKFVAIQRARILRSRKSFRGTATSRGQGRMLGEIMGFREQRSQMFSTSKVRYHPRKRRRLTSTHHVYNTDSEVPASSDESADELTSGSTVHRSDIYGNILMSTRKRTHDQLGDAGHQNFANSSRRVARKDLFGPVLSMFHFHRKILDEISYLNAYKESALKAIPSNITWLLSGTARLRDPMDVKRIATMVGVHIGPDDDSLGHYTTDSRRAVDTHRSEPEKIEASKIIHTAAWHKRRLITSQAFLDRFARTNLVELPVTSQIRVKEIVYASRLPALHAILYHESRVLLLSQNFKDNLTFIGQGRHDRSMRLHFVLHNTTTIEEALTKASFHISRAEGYSLMQHRCHELPDLDYAQVLEARADDVLRITRAVIRRVDEFVDWLTNDIDCSDLDKKDANFLLDVVKRAMWLIRTKLFRGLQDADAFDQFHRIFAGSRLFKINYGGMTAKEARRRLDKLGRFIDSMVSSVRALRFLKNAHRLQEMAWNEDDGYFVDDVGHTAHLSNAHLNGLCGHLICQRCMHEIGNSGCPVTGCGAGSGPELMIHAEDLGESCRQTTTSSNKIQTIINIVKALRKDAQALVFCQWHDINEILIHHLDRAGINAKYIREGEGSTADKVAGFKSLSYGHANWTKVLVLNPTSATAAGHNLQNVNAIIFLTPLSGSSIDDYKASYAQAIGRAARYGQKNIVAVYHLLLSRTVEINIHESRRNTKLYEKDGKLVECDTEELPPNARQLAVNGYVPQMPE